MRAQPVTDLRLTHTPIVYLDQCHWVTLARAIYAPHKIKVDAEREAAEVFLRAARVNRVILPLSGAHMVETARAGEARRRGELADTMIDLYAGWHMSSPVKVRREELRLALTGPEPTVARTVVFNRLPGTPFASGDECIPNDAASPSGASDVPGRLAWGISFEKILRSGTYSGDEKTTIARAGGGWAAAKQVFAEWIAANPAERDLRLVAAGVTLTDLGMEFPEEVKRVGLDPAELAARVNEHNLIEFFQQMPFLGRCMEVFRIRLCNPQKSWVSNDLEDMMFLSCAAAYADVVIAEKHTAHLLQVASRWTRPGAVVFPSLRNALQTLHDAS